MRFKIIVTGARIATVVRSVEARTEVRASDAARAEMERLRDLDPNARAALYRNAGCRGMVLLGAWQRGEWIAA